MPDRIRAHHILKLWDNPNTQRECLKEIIILILELQDKVNRILHPEYDKND